MLKSDKMHYETLRRLLSDESYSDEGQEVRPKYLDGTPAHTRFITNVVQEYDLSKGELPLLTLRPTAWKAGVNEILWIYRDESNDLSLLRDKYGIKYWDEWDIGDGTIGQRYGATVRKHNLMKNLINDIKENPYGRRHIMSLWQDEDFKTEGLNPCCFMTIWVVRGDYLDCTLIQRSSDYIVSVSINEIQYVALQMMIAKECGYKVGKFTHYIANLHIYDRHIEQAEELIKRYEEMEKREIVGDLTVTQPKFLFNPKSNNFYDFTIDDFEIVDYEPIKPQLKFELGV